MDEETLIDIIYHYFAEYGDEDVPEISDEIFEKMHSESELPEEIEELDFSFEYDGTIRYNGNLYCIMDENDYNEYIDEMIDNYIDDCILPDIPEDYRCYFDTEKFMNDVSCGGERDSFANSYDGCVNDFKFDSVWYKIWRVD